MRTSLNVPEDLLREFDDSWQTEGLDSRSRAIREAMSEYIESHRSFETAQGPVTGVVVFDYEHEHAIKQLHDIQHDYQNAIVSTSHAHQGDWCLETVFVKSNVEEVRELVYALKDFDGVRRVRSMLL